MLSIIVAVARNNVIGRDGTLPWKLSSDLRRFKKITMGGTLVMGRKTYESIGRPLPGRTSIVVTGQHGYEAPGCQVAGSFQQALDGAGQGQETFVIGGARMYKAALPVASRLYWTAVQADVDGDTFFPSVSWHEWAIRQEERFPADGQNEYSTCFRIFEKTGGLPGQRPAGQGRRD